MPQSERRMQELLEKANSLPMTPGVYIMRDRNDKVIYVGKSAKLKSRVSQYFQNSQKNFKTSRMVYFAEDFDYILCTTEIEALTLENVLIKQHSPKYNIRLKDAKSYPYIKITSEEYPRIQHTRSRLSDKGKYYGPFTGTATVYAVLDVLRKTLGLPSCKKQFPRDIGKERPCLYYHMNQCCGVCTGKVSREDYGALIRCAAEILKGNTSATVKVLEQQMFAFAEEEKFEEAARCRNAIEALKHLNQKQHVVASPGTDQDVFGLYTDSLCTCISAMYVRDGVVTDKADFPSGADVDTDSSTLTAFLAEHYRIREFIPKTILLSFSLEAEDVEVLSSYLSEKAGRKIEIRVPMRGDLRALCEQVADNAAEKARQYRLEAQKDDSVLVQLASILQLEVLPQRIEAYDVSNIGSENIVCGMIVCEDGKFCRADYRSFGIREVQGTTDDYASMREALQRRFTHMMSDTTGSFSKAPDLILLDGGRGHVSMAVELCRSMQISVPIYGMVKDDYHKTRALCTESAEINIAKERSVYNLIYRIQEEVHRFTVSKSSGAKRKTMKHSILEKIDGIGPAKAKKLLHAFGGLGGVKSATEAELAAVSGITAGDAKQIYSYFNKEKSSKEKS